MLILLADQAISDWEQQQITREVNFSETAFIFSGKQADGGYPVRIWTPNTGEVPFAGHPTLGCAYVIQPLIEQGYPDEVKPESRSDYGQPVCAWHGNEAKASCFRC